MSVTQLAPATGPANTTLPAAGARTSSPTGAAMSIPRCPGPYGPARASNPRTSGPVTGIHNPGTRADRGATGAHERGDPLGHRDRSGGRSNGAGRQERGQEERPPAAAGLAAASGYAGNMGSQAIGRDGVVRTARTLPGGEGRRTVIHENVDNQFRGPGRRIEAAHERSRRPASTTAASEAGPAQPVPRTPGRTPGIGRRNGASGAADPDRQTSEADLAARRAALARDAAPGTAMAIGPIRRRRLHRYRSRGRSVADSPPDRIALHDADPPDNGITTRRPASPRTAPSCDDVDDRLNETRDPS